MDERAFKERDKVQVTFWQEEKGTRESIPGTKIFPEMRQ